MITFRKTITKPHDIMDSYIKEFLQNISGKDYDWVNVSDSYPIIMKEYLHYTVTITAGKNEK